MTKPKPRVYVVNKARLEWGTAAVLATSAKQAEQIARENYDIYWTFEPGNQVRRESAQLARGDDLEWFADDAYRDPELFPESLNTERES
jgi:hypothetical protein